MRIKTNDNYTLIVLKNTYENIKDEITLSATLQQVYAQKLTIEIVSTKLANQANSMEVAVNRINPKFGEKKSKSYDRVKTEMIQALENFEENLQQFCAIFDEKIEKLILKKVELESKLLICLMFQQKLYKKEMENDSEKSIVNGLNTVVKKIKGKVSKKESMNPSKDGQDSKKDMNQSDEWKQNKKNIAKLEKEIRKLNRKIEELTEEKTQKVFQAMESENKSISTTLRKPRTFGKIKRFFINRFSTEKAIRKNVIEPFCQRIDEFKVNELKLKEHLKQEFNLLQLKAKIESAQNLILEDVESKLLRKELGMMEKR